MLPGGMRQLHPSFYTNSGAGEPVTVWFWNHTAKGALALVAPVAAASFLFTKVPRWWCTAWALPLTLVGRHALVIYVGHLLVLGALDRWLKPPAGALALSVSVALLLSAFFGVALVLESVRGRALQRKVQECLAIRI
jgi:hypothetical protein